MERIKTLLKQWPMLILGALIALALVYQRSRIESLQKECKTYKHNTAVLQGDLEVYITKDSLNAAKIGALQLTLSEFEEYRAKDAEIISTLRIENKDLRSVITAQTSTITELKTTVRDSLIYLPDVVKPVPVKKISYEDEFMTLEGIISDDAYFTGNVISKDYITIIQTVKYERFLGFLWKTKRIKDCEFDISSRNPHTTITGFEVVTIEN